MTKPIEPSHEPPKYLFPFLTDSGSLTKKLRTMTGQANVKVISGAFQPPDWWSRYFLNLNCEKLFQREILMTSFGYTCWYARSYIPSATWYLHATFFDQLANKNLGDILFDNYYVQKVSSTFFSIGKEAIPYYWPPESVLSGCDKLWLKLSHFTINKQGLFYLIELFLPELELCLEQNGLPIGN